MPKYKVLYTKVTKYRFNTTANSLAEATEKARIMVERNAELIPAPKEKISFSVVQEKAGPPPIPPLDDTDLIGEG